MSPASSSVSHTASPSISRHSSWYAGGADAEASARCESESGGGSALPKSLWRRTAAARPPGLPRCCCACCASTCAKLRPDGAQGPSAPRARARRATYSSTYTWAPRARSRHHKFEGRARAGRGALDPNGDGLFGESRRFARQRRVHQRVLLAQVVEFLLKVRYARRQRRNLANVHARLPAQQEGLQQVADVEGERRLEGQAPGRVARRRHLERAQQQDARELDGRKDA
eukprot:988012-Prymnesium_polylepis.1